MPRTTSVLRFGALLPAAGLLAACGYFSGSKPSGAAHGPPATAQAPQAQDAAAQALAAMVDAVGPSSAQIPVELKFSIHDRPQVGQDDEVDYALIPQISGIETLHVAFGALEGLQVTNHGPTLAAIRPAIGAPIFGSVTVRPLKTGLFTLTAAVGLITPTESVTWPFRIPIIVAEGPAQTAQAALTAATAPTGQMAQASPP